MIVIACVLNLFMHVLSLILYQISYFVCVLLKKYHEIFGRACYMGHPISSDNGFTSQKLLLKSELYIPLHVAMGVS